MSHLQEADTPVEAPVFILGCTWRCGSTLLQRLLCTVDDLLIWGENLAISSLFMDMCARLRSKEERSRIERAAFRQKGDTWIANMRPPLDSVDELCRQWLSGFYGPATLSFGKSRWGFKEVRHDALVADFLRHLYPAGRVVLLIRNPVDVTASMRSSMRTWYHQAGARSVLDTWCRNVASFLEARHRHFLIRYEDLVAKPAETLATLETELALNAGAIGRGPLDVVLRGGRRNVPPELGEEEVLALGEDRVLKLARECGYDLKADARIHSHTRPSCPI
jgi:hypothetical protein